MAVCFQSFAITWASLPPCGCAEPSRDFDDDDDFASDDFVPIVCCIAAFILCIMPPEPLCVLLPLALWLSFSFEWAFANSRSLRFASDLDRGRNTSKMVGRRFGLAMPCTVDWLMITSPSPLFRRSNEFDRLFFDLQRQKIWRYRVDKPRNLVLTSLVWVRPFSLWPRRWIC